MRALPAMQYFIYIFYERFKQLSAKSVMWMCGFVCRCESVCATKCSPQPSHVCIKCIGLTLLLVCCYYYLGFSFWLLALLLSLSLTLSHYLSHSLSVSLAMLCFALCEYVCVFAIGRLHLMPFIMNRPTSIYIRFNIAFMASYWCDHNFCSVHLNKWEALTNM